MNCGLFGVRFSVLWHKKGAVAPVDYLSTFATAPYVKLFSIFIFIHNTLNSLSWIQNTANRTIVI